MCLAAGPFKEFLKERVHFSRNDYNVVMAYDGLEVSLVECNSCEFVFVSPLPAHPDFFPFKYDVTKYENEYGRSSKAKINKDIVSLVGKRVGVKGTWLDIGANEGELLDRAYEQGHRTYGVEVSNRNLKPNHTFFKGTAIEFLNENQKKYDVVTLVDVLEHLEEPRSVLEAIFNTLNEEGLLYIKVPHYKGQLFKQKIAKLFSLNNYSVLEELDHINHYTPKSLKSGLVSIGFQVVKSGITRSELFRNSSLKNIMRNLGREAFYLVGFLLSKTLGFYFGFNFYVLVKKGASHQ